MVVSRVREPVIVYEHKVTRWKDLFSKFGQINDKRNKNYFYKMEQCKIFNDSTKELNINLMMLFKIYINVYKNNQSDCFLFEKIFKGVTEGSYFMNKREFSQTMAEVNSIIYLGSKNAKKEFNRLDEIDYCFKGDSNKTFYSDNKREAVLMKAINYFGIEAYQNIVKKGLEPKNFNDKILISYIKSSFGINAGLLSVLVQQKNYDYDYISKNINGSDISSILKIEALAQSFKTENVICDISSFFPKSKILGKMTLKEFMVFKKINSICFDFKNNNRDILEKEEEISQFREVHPVVVSELLEKNKSNVEIYNMLSRHFIDISLSGKKKEKNKMKI